MPRRSETRALWAGLGEARLGRQGEILPGGRGSKDRGRGQPSERPALWLVPHAATIGHARSPGRCWPGGWRNERPKARSRRKQGKGPRGAAVHPWNLQNLWRSGPLWEPPLAKKGPRTWAGTLGYRVPPPLPMPPGPRANGGGPRTYGQADANPRLARLPSVHPGAGTRSQRWPPCPDGPRLERESRVTVSRQRKAGDQCPPCNRVQSLPAWRPLLWGPGPTGSRPMPAVAWGSPILAHVQPNHAPSAAQANIEGCTSAASQAPKVLGSLVPRAGALPAPAPRNMRWGWLEQPPLAEGDRSP